MWRFCSLFSFIKYHSLLWILLPSCTVNKECYQKILYCENWKKNSQSFGKQFLDLVPQCKHRLTLITLNILGKKTNKQCCNDVSLSYLPDMATCHFFLFPSDPRNQNHNFWMRNKLNIPKWDFHNVLHTRKKIWISVLCLMGTILSGLTFEGDKVNSEE